MLMRRKGCSSTLRSSAAIWESLRSALSTRNQSSPLYDDKELIKLFFWFAVRQRLPVSDVSAQSSGEPMERTSGRHGSSNVAVVSREAPAVTSALRAAIRA